MAIENKQRVQTKTVNYTMKKVNNNHNSLPSSLVGSDLRYPSKGSPSLGPLVKNFHGARGIRSPKA